MKRLFIVIALLLVPCAVFAFDTKRQSPRIGVLRAADTYPREDERLVADFVARYLREGLRQRGFDAYDTGLTFDEVADGEGEDADYYVEIQGANTRSGSYGGLGIGTYDAGVSFEVLVARVAADVRIYDGPTGALLKSEALSKRKTSVMPTSIGIGGSRLFAVIAMPFVRDSQFRSAARAAAKSAVSVVVETLGEP